MLPWPLVESRPRLRKGSFLFPLQPTAGIDEATKLLESAVGKSRRLNQRKPRGETEGKKTAEATLELALTVSITPPPYVPGLFFLSRIRQDSRC